jgi:hypothetical protein
MPQIMKALLIILLFVFLRTNSLHGQTYDKVATNRYSKGEPINKTDSLGQKQGLWINYDMFFNSICSALSTGQSDTCFRRISSGQYFDNKKIGEWKYYDDGGCYILVKRTVTFNPDRSMVEINLRNYVVTSYSADSTLVTSVITAPSDTVSIACKDQKFCITSAHNIELKKFDYKYLDYEQLRISSDAYRREILLLKDNGH